MIYGERIPRDSTDLTIVIPEDQSCRKSIVKEPDLWRIFQRLADPMQPASIIRARYLEKNLPETTLFKELPVCSFPEKGGLGCMCYENVMHYVREACRYTPPSYRCRALANHSDRRSKGQSKRATNENSRYQFPLATIIVRWQLKRLMPGYDLNLLRHLLSRYGQIKDLRMLSQNSALVIFDELSSACKVVQSQYLGDPHNKLHARWWHKAMDNKTVYCIRNGVKIKQDPFLSI